jgi:cytosine/adenosine deaminase-related metal-dependent hydrolase
MSVVLDRGARGTSFVVEGGLLRAAEPGMRLRGRIDCAWHPSVELVAGAVNAHTHLYSALAPLGMPKPATEPRNFVEILESVWWRLDRALDERSLRASARLYVAEALLAGTTSLIDHHESPNGIEGSLDVLADAAQELGARLVVCYGATERNGGRAEARNGLAECVRFAKSNKRELVTGLVALHASFTVSDDTLREAGEIAAKLGVGVHVHVAEDRADVDDAVKRGFLGPLERMLQLGALPRGSVLAHGVHLTADQVRRADETGLWLVHNPRSNEGNRVGYARHLRHSAHVALGTDGWPADMHAEREALRRLGLQNGDETDAAERRSRSGLALMAALTRAPLAESLATGVAADVVARVPGEAPRHVLVGGRVVVRDGQLVAADIAEIRARAREEAPRVWTRMAKLSAGAPSRRNQPS